METIKNYGTAAQDIKDVSQAAHRVLRFAGNLREKLGEKSGLLDDFLRSILENFMDVISVATEGIDIQFSDMRGLYRKVIDGKLDEAQEHPLYEKLTAFLAKHEPPHNAHDTELPCVGLFEEYSAFAFERYTSDFDKRLHKAMAEKGVPEAHRALSAEIGKQQTDLLYGIIMNTFILVSPASIFMQALLEQLATSLIVPDRRNGDYFLFQHMLDNGIY